MTLVIDLKRALREPEYRAELCDELEGGVSEMVMEAAADRIDALEKALREIKVEYDPSEDGANARTMFEIAGAALGEGE